ncbi:MAG: ergothioneine biosynthesis protein EgtB [Pleurocapsa sp.]
MTSLSIQFLRKSLLQDLQQCRQKTLDLLNEIEPDCFSAQSHPDFSPIGWHFGHIAFTEAYWILEHLAKFSPQFPQYHRLFAADGLPKTERQNLPAIATIVNYLATVRSAVLDYLQTAPIQKEERLWRWLIQHESQHNETIILIWQLHRHQRNLIYQTIDFSHSANSWETSPVIPQSFSSKDLVKIEAGEFISGSDKIFAQDNERPPHKIYLDTYWIDPYPVTCQQYQAFISAGGYQNSSYWSEAGWQWLQNHPVDRPLYWSDAPEWQNHPVCGVNYYEAEAYAKFVGKRLPTEAEWEKAATFDRSLQAVLKQCNHDGLIGHTTPVNAYPDNPSIYGCYDLLGNVWEWTVSRFDGYAGFTPYPYSGYSQAYFDGQHKVLRGGSWATRPWSLRASFRNWYHPWVRQIIAGFRCATDNPYT